MAGYKRFNRRDVILDEMEIVLADPFISIAHYCAVAWLRKQMLKRMGKTS